MKPLVLFLFVSIPGILWTIRFQQILEKVDTLEKQGVEQHGRILHLANQLEQCSCHDINEGETDKIKSAKSLYRNKSSHHDGNALKRFVLGSEMVAFHALLGEKSSNNAVGHTLVFENSLINIGGAYNHLTGIFVAPISGIYIFSTSLAAEKSASGNNHVDIMKNGIEIGAAYGTGLGGLHQGSITIVTELSIGDEIHVSTQRHNNIAIFPDKLTSFMGCLILPL